ncbi:NAD(P)H-quinone oxidoreductase, partial [Nostoc sp. CMAA1605]|nr:NAD(P)H-quinone oxidoreductase [Nostoc sp. CMAA1605]
GDRSFRWRPLKDTFSTSYQAG